MENKELKKEMELIKRTCSDSEMKDIMKSEERTVHKLVPRVGKISSADRYSSLTNTKPVVELELNRATKALPYKGSRFSLEDFKRNKSDRN